ncbi:hypothetical protein BDZ89DRAFT_1041966 [Hymenopellis radicata]|nr:hypothetical protein BDZ89DRAFT_1041966 [Hymenopellis radicata]
MSNTIQSPRRFSRSQLGSFEFANLKVRESPNPAIKANEVLVKTQAVSTLQAPYHSFLRFQDLLQIQDNLVPYSTVAGEILVIGETITKWNVGDRVCANFDLVTAHDELVVYQRAVLPHQERRDVFFRREAGDREEVGRETWWSSPVNVAHVLS